MDVLRLFGILVLASNICSLGAQDLDLAQGISRALASASPPSRIGANSTVDAAVTSRLARLRQEVRKWVVARLATASEQADLTQLQRSMVSDLRRAGLMADPDSTAEHRFGMIRVLSLYRIAGPDRVEVVMSYDSPCPADDSVLFFNTGVNGQLHLLLSLDNSDFTHFWGIRDLFYAGISPLNDAGEIYAIAIRTSSLCEGFGGRPQIGFEVFRPGPTPAETKRIGRRVELYRDHGDVRLLMEKDSFTLDYPGWSITASTERTQILKYLVKGEGIHRIQPVAVNAEGFVEEWIGSAWDQAREWSNRQSTVLPGWHAKLHGEYGVRPSALGDTAFQQTCSDASQLIQITFPVEFPTVGPKAGDLYFVVRESEPYTFRMETVRQSSLLGCSPPKVVENQMEHLLPASRKVHRQPPGNP